MKLLITGGKGLLAHALKGVIPAEVDCRYWDVEEFDLTQPENMRGQLQTLQPDWVINTAAYNLVDRCEQERELSWAVNARGPELLAALCAGMNIRLVHFSSDYVFEGAKREPYLETDAPNPVNHYGAGKLFGEQAVLRASPENVVVRTSWLFGSHPTQTKTFIHTILRLAKGEKPIKATTDQVSAPTYAPDLARCVWKLMEPGCSGLFHGVNSEGLSRYDWTLEIINAAQRKGLLGSRVPPVEPVLTSFFGGDMRRPVYTVLSNAKANSVIGVPFPSWRAGLDIMLTAGV